MKRKLHNKRRGIALIALLLVSFTMTAQAWMPDARYDTISDLPDSIASLIPSHFNYAYGMSGGETVYTMLKDESGVLHIAVFMRDAIGIYQIDEISAPLHDLNGTTPVLGCSGDDTLYLMYDTGEAFYTFERCDTGVWLLQNILYDGNIEIMPSLGILTENFDADGEYTEVFTYGRMYISLDSVITEKLPINIDEAVACLDTEGLAVVTSDNPDDMLPLWESPSNSGTPLGEYYRGTPVQAESISGDFAKVSICGISGYMMKKYLVQGTQTASIQRAFPVISPIEELDSEGTAIYRAPNTSSEIVGRVYEKRHGWHNLFILGTVGDDWYHVLLDEGISGYVQTEYFWDGKG